VAYPGFFNERLVLEREARAEGPKLESFQPKSEGGVLGEDSLDLG